EDGDVQLTQMIGLVDIVQANQIHGKILVQKERGRSRSSSHFKCMPSAVTIDLAALCGLGFGKRRNRRHGGCCPSSSLSLRAEGHTPAGRIMSAARAREICWGRNRLLLSPCRWFRPQLPPLPDFGELSRAGRGTPPVGVWESTRLARGMVRAFPVSLRSLCSLRFI